MKASACSYPVSPGSMRHSTADEPGAGRKDTSIWLRSGMKAP